jgi:hypothetical protein
LDTLTAEKLAAVLQEPNVLLLRQVLRVLGEAHCRDLLAETLTIESQGGMLINQFRLLLRGIPTGVAAAVPHAYSR